MGTHPNAMLQCVIKPDQGSRKTARDLHAEYGKSQDSVYSDDYLVIGGLDYSIEVMESDYSDSWQISADEGDIVLHDYLTYGYGESEDWDSVVARATALIEWAEAAKVSHQFSYKIRISANYW